MIKTTLYSIIIFTFYTSILNSQSPYCISFERTLNTYCQAPDNQKDSIWQYALIQHTDCLNEFYKTIIYGWNWCFGEKEINQVRAILNDSLDLSNEHAILAAGVYQATNHQYTIAKLADPDFFDELTTYLRFIYLKGKQPPNTSSFYKKKMPHIALANMGDTLVENKIINIMLNMYDSLLIQFNQSKDTTEYIYNIDLLDRFLNDQSPKYLGLLFTRRSLFKTLRMFDLDLSRDYFWAPRMHGHEHSMISCRYLERIIFKKFNFYQMLDIRDNIYSNCWGVLPEEKRLEFKKQKEQLIQDIKNGKIELIPLIR